MKKSVLITGGSGGVGRELTRELLRRGHSVSWLSRRPGQAKAPNGVQVWAWDPMAGSMDPKAIEGVEVLIHLAGAGIADKPWTSDRRQLILDSRVQTARFLHGQLSESKTLEQFVSASAIGFYSGNPAPELHEGLSGGSGFLAETGRKWEQAALEFQDRVPVMIWRFGLVLGRGFGYLGKLEPLYKWGLGAPLGSKQNWLSWIHISDLCHMMCRGMEEQWSGVGNMVSPEPVKAGTFYRKLSKRLNRPAWSPAVPSWLILLLMGERGRMLLESQKVVPGFLDQKGASFLFPDLDSALADLYHGKNV